MSQLETDEVRKRYEGRKTQVVKNLYSWLNPEVWQSIHERQRVMLRLFAQRGVMNFENTRVVEVGCGTGGNLLEFLRLGFQPPNLIGIELLEDRVSIANKVLPVGIVRAGDATVIDIAKASQDIVFQLRLFVAIRRRLSGTLGE